MSLLSVVMLGLAVSIDGFGVGFAYGLRKVHIPPVSLLIICVSSALSVYVSMLAGGVVAGFINPQTAGLVGGLMLMGVGFLIVRQSLGGGDERADAGKGKGISFFSDMLREPGRADFDNSGVITGKEAMALGVALAMDAFGAGFGAAMMGFSPLATSLAVGMTKLILVTGGLQLGKRYSNNVSGDHAAIFAGLVLMLLGITHLIY